MSSNLRHLFALFLLLTLANCSRPTEPPTATRPNILLITIDTLRADRLSSYGHYRQTSPNLDRLAAAGVRFDRAAVQWPKTGPSFASMFTSTYPKDNGVVLHVGIPVPDDLPVLAEELQQLGYATRAVVANGALATEFGFGRGFERYVESWLNPLPASDAADPNRIDPNGATRVTDLALELVAELAAEGRAAGTEGRPYFLWVHYLDPHFPYAPPPAYRDRFQNDEHWDGTRKVDITTASTTRQMTGIGYKQVLDGRDELDFYTARYDAEIAYADAEVGRLLNGIAEAGLDQETVTVVSSDHGESLGEHHFYFDHGRFAFQTCVRVPLIFHFPDTLEPRVDPEPVELLDLSPTLLDLAGASFAQGSWSQGHSLVERLRNGPGDSTYLAFTEAGHSPKRRWQRAVQNQRFKLVLAPGEKASMWLPGKQLTLYDLQEDPGETEDAGPRHPEVRAELESTLRRWLQTAPRGLVEEREQDQQMDPETLQQLRALGYLD